MVPSFVVEHLRHEYAILEYPTIEHLEKTDGSEAWVELAILVWPAFVEQCLFPSLPLFGHNVSD